MAICIPSDVKSLTIAGGHGGEIDTLIALQKDLSDRFTVYHSVYWTMPTRNGLRVGEVDFIIVGPNGKVLLIEQKNGHVEQSNGGFTKHYRDNGSGKDKRVDQQVDRAMSNLREKYQSQHSGDSLRLDHLFLFPDTRVSAATGTAVNRSRIVDATDRKFLSAKVEKLLSGDTDVSKTQLKQIHRFFRQHFQVVPDIGARVQHANQSFVRLT